MELATVYFEKPGPQNTDRTLALVQSISEERHIETVVVATCTGRTGLLAAERLKGKNLVVITHSTGFHKENQQELTPENRQKIESLGATILTCQHALAGVSRAVRFKFNTYEIDELIAQTLRIFGQGLKVCAEICLMAADAGLIRTDGDVIAVGGTGRGADTAAVIKPANVSRFFDLRIRGILCKPWDF